MDRDAALSLLTSAAADLTEPRRHLEPFWAWNSHGSHRVMSAWSSDQPSLLDQLRDLAAEPPVDEPTVGGGAFESRPPGGLDALDRLVVIDAAVDDWTVRRLGLARRDVHLGPDQVCRHGIHGQARPTDDPGPACRHCDHQSCRRVRAARRGRFVRCAGCSLAADVTQLVGAAGRLGDDQAAELASDVARWRGWANVLTGWVSPPYAPQAPCPACDRAGRLRVRLDTHRGSCLECGQVWDQATIGVLAEHIRGWEPEPPAAAEVPCPHSWRRHGPVDGAGAQAGVCVLCAAGDWRLAPPCRARCQAGACARCDGAGWALGWPAGTPAWTELDAAVARERMGA